MNKEMQLALRQILGVYASLDINFKDETKPNWFDKISHFLPILFSIFMGLIIVYIITLILLS